MRLLCQIAQPVPEGSKQTLKSQSDTEKRHLRVNGLHPNLHADRARFSNKAITHELVNQGRAHQVFGLPRKFSYETITCSRYAGLSCRRPYQAST